MPQEKFAVRLSGEDRTQLERLIRSGQHSARVINRARILLKTDAGGSASQVAAALDTSPRTVFRTLTRTQFVIARSAATRRSRCCMGPHHLDEIATLRWQ